MARLNKLAKLVQKEPELIGSYKPSRNEIQEIYHLLNYHIFDNSLTQPVIKVRQTRGYWGMCVGSGDKGIFTVDEIILTNNYPGQNWLIFTIAHEMVHQYQWEILSPERYKEGKKQLMSHGPSFFEWREPLSEYNIPLSINLSRTKL